MENTDEKTSLDQELDTLRVCALALEKLDEKMLQRALNYLNSRFDKNYRFSNYSEDV